jgi:hypothetical protein
MVNVYALKKEFFVNKIICSFHEREEMFIYLTFFFLLELLSVVDVADESFKF